MQKELTEIHLTKDDLSAGNILPIYKNYKEQKELEGKAELIQHDPPKYGSEDEYIKREIGGTAKQGPIPIFWKVQRWKVKFIQSGFISHRYISYFHRRGWK